MNILALLAAGATPVVVVPPDPPPSGEWPDYDPPADTTPYAFPTTLPYNAPVAALTPTADGSGHVIHPSVIDFQTQFGMTNWNGFRYWMGITGFKAENPVVENPHVLASHDGYTWQNPPGMTNPLDLYGPAGYNSDTEIVYDPTTARLYCYWRETQDSTPRPELIHAAWSVNGSDWELNYGVIDAYSPSGALSMLSPAVQWYGDDDEWRMIHIGGGLWVRTATSPLGPWSSPSPITFNYLADVWSPWHFTQTRVDGVSYGLVYVNNPGSHLVPCTSIDGQAWNVAGSAARPVVTRPAGNIDVKFYRAALTPHEDGVSFRLWYPVSNQLEPRATALVWGLAYTIVPRSLWPAPPA